MIKSCKSCPTVVHGIREINKKFYRGKSRFGRVCHRGVCKVCYNANRAHPLADRVITDISGIAPTPVGIERMKDIINAERIASMQVA